MSAVALSARVRGKGGVKATPHSPFLSRSNGGSDERAVKTSGTVGRTDAGGEGEI